MTLTQKIPFQKIYLVLLTVFCFLFPLAPRLTAPILILYVFFWIIENISNSQFYLFKTEKFRYWLLIPCIFYLLHVVGMIYSKNKSFGLLDLQIKLPIFLFPLYFSTLPKVFFCEKNVKKLFYAFIMGSLAFVFYAMFHSLYVYETNTDMDFHVFFYSYLSHHIHPSYASLFSILSILFCFYLYPSTTKKSIKILLIITFIILFFFVLLLSSKAGILSLFTILISSLILAIFKMKRNIKPLLISIFVFLLLSFGLILNRSNFISQRFSDVIPAIKGTSEVASSSNVRINLWRTAIHLMPQYFWTGTGTGDVKDVFIETYAQQNIEILSGGFYNLHSQFLQSFLALGIFGFLFLILFLVLIPLYLGIKNKYPLLLLFVILATINCLVESMLEVQVGVMFFTFFYCLFLMHSFAKKFIH